MIKYITPVLIIFFSLNSFAYSRYSNEDECSNDLGYFLRRDVSNLLVHDSCNTFVGGKGHKYSFTYESNYQEGYLYHQEDCLLEFSRNLNKVVKNMRIVRACDFESGIGYVIDFTTSNSHSKTTAVASSSEKESNQMLIYSCYSRNNDDERLLVKEKGGRTFYKFNNYSWKDMSESNLDFLPKISGSGLKIKRGKILIADCTLAE
ncbi:MAG: hypothetical protein V4596_14300 [Bdellovibrionota bacterium]